MLRKLKNSAHFLIAFLVIRLLNHPSKKLRVIGVTGTDGKTTTSNFVYQLLTLSGKKTALVSTVGVIIDGRKELLGPHVTTPSSLTLNRYLKKAVESGVEFAVLEVSSHALDQNRILGIRFDAGTITNVTNEHLDYHKTIENYLNAKTKLLKVSENSILDSADPFLEKIKKQIQGKRIFTYSLNNKDSDLRYSEIKNQFTEKLTSYNKKNLLASVLILKTLGFDINRLKKSFEKLSLPEGRLSYLKKEPFEVIIDFAHTPNAFQLLLPEIRSKIKGRLIHVFGSAGRRDKNKRPEMGRISSETSDIMILTAEDPRDEKVVNINNDIKKGVSKDFIESNSSEFSNDSTRKMIIEIEDRREAISFALKIAKKGDCVIITGKGPEKSMNIKGKEIPWDDIQITKKLLS